MDVYIEAGVGGHIDNATQAWTFDPDAWGRCGQGIDEETALTHLRRQLDNTDGELNITERIHGDEQAFKRDNAPARPIERELTKQILSAARAETIDILSRCDGSDLDWIDPDRRLPAWATWHSLREMAWHLLETESGYYLSRLDIRLPPLEEDLLAALRDGVARTASAIDALPLNGLVEIDGEQWTPVKVLRRLAWHERSELVVIRELATKAQQSGSHQ